MANEDKKDFNAMLHDRKEIALPIAETIGNNVFARASLTEINLPKAVTPRKAGDAGRTCRSPPAAQAESRTVRAAYTPIRRPSRVV